MQQSWVVRNPIRFLGCAAILLAAVLLVAPAAQAQRGLSLIDDATRLGQRSLPKLRIPPTIRLAPQADNAYGVADTAVVATLDEAKAAQVQVAESAAQEATTTSEAADFAEGCIEEGLKQAAQDYIDAEARQEVYPPLGEAVYYGVHGCLSNTFDAPGDAIDAVASYFASQVAGEPARTAADTAPAAFANWLNATGNALGGDASPDPDFTPTSPAGDTSSDDTEGEDGSSFPWWLFLVAVAVIGGVLYVRSQQS
jgi:hypothetical protein